MLKRTALLLAPLALIVAFSVSACGKVPSSGSTNTGANCPSTQTIGLAQTDFAIHCVTVKANQAVTFNDPTSGGGVHIICIGHNGSCQAGATGPKDLLGSGFMIQPGHTHQVTFTTAGTYKLACTIHPNMNMTVTVQ
ncbi:MAG TPA: plastocyanin/azurin family copper-binding protein [Ktedonobacterales bacterium]|nr:plastocyanin/azurin family copper-binding protein [Ktedonobacterales bacterium]